MTTNLNTYTFQATIIKPDDGIGAYIDIPFDLLETFNRKRVFVHATFDEEPYDGMMVKMGTPNAILIVPKKIREKIKKEPGDQVLVSILERLK